MVSIARDFLIELHPTVHSDSTAALGITYRRGLGGKTRHVKVQYLWIQGTVANKELAVKKVGSAENPSDLLTKFLGAEPHSKHVAKLSYEFPSVDSGKGSRSYGHV